MLRIGLTGGIGAGKSTVARRLVELGAVLVDSDVVAREVVQPGSPGLVRVVEAFGPDVLDPSGALDRPKLGSIVFADPDARRRLNAILHPLIGRRTAELVAEAPADSIVVQDIPLLVENSLGAAFALVVVVHASEEERTRRLVHERGMTVRDARSRIAAQADDAARAAAADVWLDNSSGLAEVRARVDQLWHERLVPFAENMRMDRPVPAAPPRLVESDPDWPAQYARLAARIAAAAGVSAGRVDHVGSTAVPGLPARDVLDIQLTVPSLAAADQLRSALRAVGFVPAPHMGEMDRADLVLDPPTGRRYASSDPGRPAHLYVRELDSSGYRYSLLLRDWLRADPAARTEYLAAKRTAALPEGLPTGRDLELTCAADYGRAKNDWLTGAICRADRWATVTGWRIPPASVARAG